MNLSATARLRRALAPAALALVACAAVPARADADIERVSFTARADGRGYVVRLHTSGPVGAYSVEQEGAAVELVVYRVRLASGLRRDEARGLVRAYRIVPADDRVTLTFTLAHEGGVQAQAYPDRETDDLLLSLTTGSAVEPSPVVAVSSGRSGGGRTVDSNWRLDCVVIDAGHGGHDTGAVAHGVREKDVTLGIARRLGRLVEERLGVRVVYTRQADRFVELHERGRAANSSCGKLFVSIHANAGQPAAHGTETYFLAPHRSESAREVMDRENAVVRLESDPHLYADFDAEGGIVRALATSAYQEESQTLASLIEGQLREGRRSRGVKQAGFLVLWRASMPAVLVETGFVTNEDEARYLASAAGQDAVAGAVFRAIRAYKERYERGLGAAVGG